MVLSWLKQGICVPSLWAATLGQALVLPRRASSGLSRRQILLQHLLHICRSSIQPGSYGNSTVHTREEMQAAQNYVTCREKTPRSLQGDVVSTPRGLLSRTLLWVTWSRRAFKRDLKENNERFMNFYRKHIREWKAAWEKTGKNLQHQEGKGIGGCCLGRRGRSEILMSDNT